MTWLENNQANDMRISNPGKDTKQYSTGKIQEEICRIKQKWALKIYWKMH